MTLYTGPTQPTVMGQPIQSGFGVQSGGAIPASTNPIVAPAPLGALKPLIEAVSRGELPRNAMVTAVNGVSTGAQNPTPVADLCSNGAGNQVNLGVAIAGVAGNPVSNGANDQQVFVDGTGAQAQQVNGPTPTGTETLTSGPVSVNTSVANISLNGSYQG
jgi:hypothetical protein